MAFSNFVKPITVSQTTGASEVSWNLDVDGCSTTEPLTSFNSKSTGLLTYSGYNISSIPSVKSDGSTATTIDGIECKIICNKDARIVDNVIQLAQGGTLIGSNKASLTTGEVHTYGSSTDLWGTSLTYSDLSSLQVSVKYTSGSIPHRDTCYVYSVHLKIHYS